MGSSRNNGVCPRVYALSIPISIRFRIVVGCNYFSVLHTLSVPLEITVLPLQKRGEGNE